MIKTIALIKQVRGASLLGVVLLANGIAQAQVTAPPAGGRSLLTWDSTATYESGKNDSGETSLSAVENQKFRNIIRGIVNKRGNVWDVETRVSLNAPISKSQKILVRFWARTIQTADESGQGLIQASLGETSPPWKAQFSREFTFGANWQEFYFYGTTDKDYAPGKVALKFSFGQVPQTVEVGGIEITSYPADFDVKNLPKTRFTYAGREADAAWRANAEARIQQFRMAPIAVQVIDKAGKPVRDAAVRVELKKHAFLFGCAVDAAPLVTDTKPENAVFRRRFLELFNGGSFINSLKWEAWNGEWGSDLGRDTTMKGLEWMRQNDITFRGHVLVWPSFRNMPQSLKILQGKAKPEEIQRLVLSHIDEITLATAPYIGEWDVVNEPRDNHDLMDISGKQVLLDYFRRARNRMPQAQLVLNDYAILSPLSDGPSQQAYEDYARYLIDNGAPIDGFGFQGHFGSEVPSPMRMLKVLDRFAALKRNIRMTEFDMKGDDNELKADFIRDLLIVLFSHPSVTGFQMWGMDQAVNPDGSLTPLGESFRRQVREKWQTDVKSTSDTNGEINTRGYLGRYEVSVTQNGKTTVVPYDLRQNSQPLIVTLN